MIPLTFISDLPLAHALGWTLIHFCWQGAVIGVALACVLGVVRTSPQLRYAACCGALLLMVLSPVVTFAHLALDRQAGGAVISNSTADGWVMAPFADVQSAARSPWLEEAEASLNRSVPWLLAVWFTGVFTLLGRLNLGLFAARWMKTGEAEGVSQELQQRLQRLCGRLGIARPVRMIHSVRVEVPTVIGWMRPAILLPLECLTGLSAGQIEAVLAHELAHVRRHDYLVSVAQSMIESLLFYHPAVWWVSRKLRIERELCCDDMAVQVCGDKLAYARALTALEARRAAVPMVVLGANGGLLTMRIKRLLVQGEEPAPRFTAFTALILAVAAASLCAGSAIHARSNQNNQSIVGNRNERALQGSYRRWVNEDVRWIITREERAAFLSLKTNEERDHFIQQFWVRRNPPGSPANTFRTEYYRRIAYANEHFASNIPGWETDRGRIYILYGPPDSIDAFPKGGRGISKAYELWHYRQIRENGPPKHLTETNGYKATVIVRKNVDFKFIDTCGCGEYKLQSGTGAQR